MSAGKKRSLPAAAAATRSTHERKLTSDAKGKCVAARRKSQEPRPPDRRRDLIESLVNHETTLGRRSCCPAITITPAVSRRKRAIGSRRSAAGSRWNPSRKTRRECIKLKLSREACFTLVEYRLSLCSPPLPPPLFAGARSASLLRGRN